MSIVAIALYIILASHLMEDKSFTQNEKVVSGAVFILIGIFYVIFGLAF